MTHLSVHVDSPARTRQTPQGLVKIQDVELDMRDLDVTRDCGDMSGEVASVQKKTAPTYSCTHACLHVAVFLVSLERLYLDRGVPFTLSEMTKWDYICCLAVSLSRLFCGGGRKSISVIVSPKITAKR